MTKPKKRVVITPVDEWTAKEWEVAYGNKCRELEKMREHMRGALQHLTKAI